MRRSRMKELVLDQFFNLRQILAEFSAVPEIALEGFLVPAMASEVSSVEAFHQWILSTAQHLSPIQILDVLQMTTMCIRY